VRLLPLAPEVNRLRRVAKACAAGELSRAEYRRTRRQLIREWREEGRHADDTVPRFDLEVTQRRFVLEVAGREDTSVRPWLLYALLFVLLVMFLVMPVWTHGNTQQIRPIAERDPNPATSERLDVSQLQWLPPPELVDIDQARVQEFLDAQLTRTRAENAPRAHGFTPTELEEVARLLNALGVHEADRTLSQADTRDLMALVASQKARRGLSVSQVEQIARALQDWVREQGFPLAAAYVPAQVVNDGVVHLEVQVGNLVAVDVVGASPVYANRVADLVGRPVRRDAVETRLNLMNRSQPLNAQAGFRAGDAVGDTRMLLNVAPPPTWSGVAQLDNYGFDQSADERLSWSGRRNGLLSPDDVLQLSAFSTLNFDHQRYGAVGYRRPLSNGRMEAAATLRYTDVKWQDDIDLDGDGLLLDVELTDTRYFTRERRGEFTYRAGVHDLDWDISAQRAWFGGAAWSGHRLWDTQRVALDYTTEAVVGVVDDARPGQDSRFWLLRGALNGWTPMQLPGIRFPAKLILGARWQIADDHLPATLRMVATGPYQNKGFDTAQVMLDQGVALEAALRFPAPLGEWWVFLDSTYGERNGLLGDRAQLTSAGIGWEAVLNASEHGTLSSRVTLGYPVAHEISGDLQDDDGTKVFWSLRFAH